MSLASRSDGALSRYFFGTLAILLLAYLGLLWVSSSPYYSFWPLAGLWAAVGWCGCECRLGLSGQVAAAAGGCGRYDL